MEHLRTQGFHTLKSHNSSSAPTIRDSWSLRWQRRSRCSCDRECRASEIHLPAVALHSIKSAFAKLRSPAVFLPAAAHKSINRWSTQHRFTSTHGRSKGVKQDCSRIAVWQRAACRKLDSQRSSKAWDRHDSAGSQPTKSRSLHRRQALHGRQIFPCSC